MENVQLHEIVIGIVLLLLPILLNFYHVLGHIRLIGNHTRNTTAPTHTALTHADTYLSTTAIPFVVFF